MGISKYWRLLPLALMVLAPFVRAQDSAGVKLIGRLDFWTPDVAVQGDIAVVLCGLDSTFRVVDVSDPENPTIRGYWHAPCFIWSIAIAGDYAFVGGYTSGLFVIDISDPDRPQRVGSYEDATQIQSIQIVGDLACFCAYYDYIRGVKILDISNPEEPSEIGHIDSPENAPPANVAVVGDIAYATFYYEGLRIYDVSDPTDPTFISLVETPGTDLWVAADEHYAYVASGEAGVRVLDISDPTNPEEVGVYDIGWEPGNGGCYTIAINGQYAAVGTMGPLTSSIRVLSIADPTSPEELGFYERDYTDRLKFSGHYIYANGTYFGIYDCAEAMGTPILDIADADLEHDFGEVHMGERSEWSFSLGNLGYPELVISGIENEEASFGLLVPERIWSLRSKFAAGEPTGDQRLYGVEFVADHFYVTGGANGEPENWVYRFDRQGNYVDRFAQFAESNWGMRDLAWDGELLWGADGHTIYGFTTDGELVTEFRGPMENCRALAWDAQREMLWVADVSEPIIGIDLEGDEIVRINHPRELRIYGMAWEEGAVPDSNGVYLLISDEEHPLRVYMMYPDLDNPDSSDFVFLRDLDTPDGALAAGAAITRDWAAPSDVLVALLDGDDDRVGIWQLTPHYLDGDFSVEPHDSTEVTVVFSPDRAGEIAADLVINSNDPGHGQVTIHINGTGLDGMAPHWQDIPSRVQATPGDMIQFEVVGSDPDNGQLRLYRERGPLPLASRFIDNGDGRGEFRWLTAPEDSGNYQLTINLSDAAYTVPGTVDLVVGSGLGVNNPRSNMPPLDYCIHPPRPNPFNASVVVGYRLSVAGKASLRLYDITGRLALTVAEGVQTAGEHRVVIDGAGLGSGVYLAKLESAGRSDVKKLVCVK